MTIVGFEPTRESRWHEIGSTTVKMKYCEISKILEERES